MTIYEQIKEVLKDKVGTYVTTSEMKLLINVKFGTSIDSIFLSDYCYNRFNKGTTFTKHLFQYINRGAYKYLGEKYPFNGYIFHKPKNSLEEVIVGEWENGQKILFEGVQKEKENSLLIKNLYEQYNEMLRLELNVLKCKPTELRHLIGRIGEFHCALTTNGVLAKEVNQHGFDVTKDNRRISVKTTAQENSFITINARTFDQFDDLYVVQYKDDEFKVIYYGPKEAILDIKRNVNSKYEVDINRIKKLDSMQMS